MKKFFSFCLVAVFCVAVLAGCGVTKEEGIQNKQGVKQGTEIMPVSDSPFREDGRVDFKKLDGLREKKFPKPGNPLEVSFGKRRERFLSSNDFWATLKKSLFERDPNSGNCSGEVALYVYGLNANGSGPDYGDYQGSFWFPADQFFDGDASAEFEAGKAYYLEAWTHSRRGYCFRAGIPLVLTNEGQEVVFNFKPVFEFLVDYCISNPPGGLDLNSYSLNGSGRYLWDTPVYDNQGLSFTIGYSFSDSWNPADQQDESVVLSFNGIDGKHLLRFTINPVKNVEGQSPVELVAKDVPLGTGHFNGNFDYETNGKITLNFNPNQGVTLPLLVKGTATMRRILVTVSDLTISQGASKIVETDPNGCFQASFETLSLKVGDTVRIEAWDQEGLDDTSRPYSSVDGVAVEVKVILSVTFSKMPLAGVTLGGKEADVANFKINAPVGYYLKEVIFSVPEGSQQVIKDAAISIGGPYSPGYVFEGNKLGINIDSRIGTTVTLSLAYNLAEVGPGAAPSGLNVKTTLESVVLQDDAKNLITIKAGVTGNDLIVYKSYPVFTDDPLDLAERKIVNNSAQDIYRPKVAAVGGDVSFKQFPKMQVWWNNKGPTQGNLQFYSFKVFRGTTDITCLVNITNQSGISIKAGAEVACLTEKDDSVFVSFETEEIVPNGTTQLYKLKATPANFDAGVDSSDQVIFMMVGDPSYLEKSYLAFDTTWGLAIDVNGTNHERLNITWSDRSSFPHDVLSADWHNGYLIPGLPLASVVMDKNP